MPDLSLPAPGDRAGATRPAAVDALAERIDALLPQTQCTQCGFAGCRPYAQALAAGETTLNRCPPGGAAGIARLAALLNQPERPLAPDCGAERPFAVARIDPDICIGCTRCIAVCPVDAIIGGPKRMHTVIDALCSGCDLCLPVCPVDCIERAPSTRHPVWTPDDAHAARERLHARRARLAREVVAHDRRMARVAEGKLEALAEEVPDALTARKRAVIEGALERARARLRERDTARGAE